MTPRHCGVAIATAALVLMSSPGMAQIWSTDRTEEAANARAREERERRARARGETIRPTLEPQVSPAEGADAQRPSVTPSAPNTSFSAPAPSAPAPSSSGSSPTTPSASPSTSVPAAATPPKPATPRLAPVGLPSTVLPRDFGLTLGDVVQQRIALPAGTAALAQPDIDLRSGRIGTWVDRLRATRERDAQGQDWLVIEHQVINVARMPRQGELPSQSLTLVGGGRLDIAPLMLGLAPVASVTANVRDVLDALRPDHPPPLPDAAAASRHMRDAAVVLAAVLLAWLAAWRWRAWRDATRKPFARALREVQRVPVEGNAAGPAWVAMHHALNAAAGRSVQAASLEPLYARQPALRAEHEALTAFFAASNARFFAQDSKAGAFDLLALARRLRRIEKRA